MLKITDEHTDLIGRIAKLTDLGVILEKEYEILFKIGNYSKSKLINYYCYQYGKHELNLIFIDEKPIKKNGVTWFCLKEVGKGVNRDYHWFTLNQLMICE